MLGLAHGQVNGKSLRHSVERASGSQAGLVVDGGRCRTRGDGGWRCVVIDSGSSGTATYDVSIDDGSCWYGRLHGPVGEPMPARISGCVRVRDVLFGPPGI